MKQIEIALVGCSFGVPNYFGGSGIAPELHTEYLLKSMGYKVKNYSRNGGSNLLTLGILENKIIDQGRCPNWIVWFQTDWVRGMENTIKRPVFYDQECERQARFAYEKMRNLLYITKSKLFMIGANAPIHPCFYEYNIGDYIIENWREKIAGKKLPFSVGSTGQEFTFIEHLLDSAERKLEITNEFHQLLDLLSNNIDYPDGCHPGERPHRELAIEIDKVIKGELFLRLLEPESPLIVKNKVLAFLKSRKKNPVPDIITTPEAEEAKRLAEHKSKKISESGSVINSIAG